MFEKVEIFLMAVVALASGEDMTSRDVERGIQSRGTVADIIVGHALDISQTHGQQGLRSVQGLNLAFLIDTEDHGLIGRIEIQPDNIADLLDKKGVGGDLKMALPVRLQAKGIPNAMNSGPGNPCLFSERANRPVATTRRLGLKGLADELGDALIRDRSGSTRAQFVVKTRQSLGQKSMAPKTDRVSAVTDLFGDGLISGTFGGHDNDPRPSHQTIRKGTGASNGF